MEESAPGEKGSEGNKLKRDGGGGRGNRCKESGEIPWTEGENNGRMTHVACF